jgi:hypothetical protein
MKLSTTNGDHCTGDGHKMVISIKGKTVDMDKVQVHPTGLIDPKEPDAKTKFLAAEALRGVGGLLLDGEGNRCVSPGLRGQLLTLGQLRGRAGPPRLRHGPHLGQRQVPGPPDPQQEVVRRDRVALQALVRPFSTL